MLKQIATSDKGGSDDKEALKFMGVQGNSAFVAGRALPVTSTSTLTCAPATARQNRWNVLHDEIPFTSNTNFSGFQVHSR